VCPKLETSKKGTSNIPYIPSNGQSYGEAMDEFGTLRLDPWHLSTGILPAPLNLGLERSCGKEGPAISWTKP